MGLRSQVSGLGAGMHWNASAQGEAKRTKEMTKGGKKESGGIEAASRQRWGQGVRPRCAVYRRESFWSPAQVNDSASLLFRQFVVFVFLLFLVVAGRCKGARIDARMAEISKPVSGVCSRRVNLCKRQASLDRVRIVLPGAGERKGGIGEDEDFVGTPKRMTEVVKQRRRGGWEAKAGQKKKKKKRAMRWELGSRTVRGHAEREKRQTTRTR